MIRKGRTDGARRKRPGGVGGRKGGDRLLRPKREPLNSGDILGSCIERVVEDYDLRTEFPLAVLEEAEKVSASITSENRNGRTDLTGLDLVTIDGADARDFDDAVHCRKDGDRFVLTVAIADVSGYVEVDGALDKEAALRGNSVYFPNCVYPMLPERLSNGVCSLVPREERLALCCEACVNPSGTLNGYRFFEGVIRSAERFTYDLADDVIFGKAEHRLAPMLGCLNELCDTLLKDRLSRGGLDIDLPETVPVIKDGTPVDFKLVHRLKAHRVIEECMLIANICAADFVKTRKIRSLYRVHPNPEFDKLAQLRATLANRGINLTANPTAQDLLRAVVQAERVGPSTSRALKLTVLQSLSKAVYTPEPSGHFGLAYDNYTHFTSPIRRYPDLLVHRDIKENLHGKSPAKRDSKGIGEHCTRTEMQADRASWGLKDMLGCVFLSSRIGDVFDAVVSSVVEFGLFVSVEPYWLDGMIRISELGKDYFIYDRNRNRLVGRRNGRVFAVGDELRVRLVRTQPEEKKTDFELVAIK